MEKLSLIAQLFAETLKNENRVFYVGAGTSGRLGVLDASECPPTFGTDPGSVVGIISGGYETLIVSKEGVEDDRQAAVMDLSQQKVTSGDLVIGIAASRRTPYTIAALQQAQELGCATVFIICNQTDEQFLSDPVIQKLDYLVAIPVGPEAITGSTRMKSGTAQKMALNIISTTAMVLLGKTYGNLMVDLQARSEKLAARSRKILRDLLGVKIEETDNLLDQAKGSVKKAIVMYKLQCNLKQAEQELARSNGILSRLFKRHQIV